MFALYWWTSILNSALPPQKHRPDTQLEHQDPVIHMAQNKRRKGKKERRKKERKKGRKIERKKGKKEGRKKERRKKEERKKERKLLK